jgi:hypothetical protein
MLTRTLPTVMADLAQPLPDGMRAKLLEILALAYPPGAAQARLAAAPDAAIAWQTQSMLDDFADAAARLAFVANDNDDGPGPDPDDARGFRGLAA